MLSPISSVSSAPIVQQQGNGNISQISNVTNNTQINVFQGDFSSQSKGAMVSVPNGLSMEEIFQHMQQSLQDLIALAALQMIVDMMSQMAGMLSQGYDSDGSAVNDSLIGIVAEDGSFALLNQGQNPFGITDQLAIVEWKSLRWDFLQGPTNQASHWLCCSGSLLNLRLPVVAA